jgi:hypothetical protein
MVVSDDDLPAGLLGSGQDPLDTPRCQRKRSLAQHVDFRFERAENVRLVKVIRRGNHNCIDLIELQQILEISEHVGDREPLRDRARLGPIVVAKGDELRSLDLREYRKVRELSYRSSTDEPKPDRISS